MRGKKLWIVFLSVMLLVMAMPLGAVSVSAGSDGVLKYTIANGQVTITGFEKDKPVDLVIPDTIEGYPVTAIKNDAFNKCKTLVSAVIPDSVTTLGNHVFFTCPNLKRVDVGDGVTEIPMGAFWYCDQLEEVVLGKSVKKIRDNTFMGCSSLKTLYIGAALRSVTSLAFDAPNLTDVYFAGSPGDRSTINFGYLNDDLENATWHYYWHDHTYTNSCDSDCNVCGEVRVGFGHVYDNASDVDCNVCGEVREPVIVYGDADGDGSVNARDVALLQQFVAGWDATLTETSADVNGDGSVNARDVALIQQYVAGWGIIWGW